MICIDVEAVIGSDLKAEPIFWPAPELAGQDGVACAREEGGAVARLLKSWSPAAAAAAGGRRQPGGGYSTPGPQCVCLRACVRARACVYV